MKRFLILTLLLYSLTGNSQINIRNSAQEISETNPKMLELVSFAKEKFKDSIDRAKFIYYWIGLNIKYDFELLEKLETTVGYSKPDLNKEYSYNYDPELVFKKKKAICYGYSLLYQWFMFELGIESTIISGHIRNERNHYVELTKDDNYRHAWNAIKINGKWILVDTTWGTSLNSSISDFYFDMKPERAIITHYPELAKWQLLENPLTLKKFNKSKFINPIWFKVGYTDNPNIKQDNKYYYFVFRNNPDQNWLVNLLYSSDNYNFKKIPELQKIIQDGYTFLRFNKSKISEKAYFKVNLYKLVGEVNYVLKYRDVINFKI